MKTIYSMSMLSLLLFLTGCATSKQVQEMIDASYQDRTAKMEAHDASIDALKQSSAKISEQNQQQAGRNQHAQNRGAGDHAHRETRLVTQAGHFRYGHLGENRCRCN